MKHMFNNGLFIKMEVCMQEDNYVHNIIERTSYLYFDWLDWEVEVVKHHSHPSSKHLSCLTKDMVLHLATNTSQR